jgi:hypothetical protein
MENAVFWMLRRVVLVRTDVSEKRTASIIRVTEICELKAMLAVTSDRSKLQRNVGSYKSHEA